MFFQAKSREEISHFVNSLFTLFSLCNIGLAGKLYFLLDMCGNPQDTRFPGLEIPYVQSKLEL